MYLFPNGESVINLNGIKHQNMKTGGDAFGSTRKLYYKQYRNVIIYFPEDFLRIIFLDNYIQSF
jgi:hypothetical protein